jgi:hypothetical protein
MTYRLVNETVAYLLFAHTTGKKFTNRGKTMTKIVLFLWVFTGGDINLTEIEGWRTMADCEAAAESFTERNPKMVNNIRIGIIGMCEEVPK